MAMILGIHGILNDFEGQETSADAWGKALRDGLRIAQCPDANQVTVNVAHYGDFFRPNPDAKAGFPRIDEEELNSYELELLQQWAGETDDKENQPVTKGRTPATVQFLLRSILSLPFFEAFAGRDGKRVLLFGLRQVYLYLHDQEIRRKILDRVDAGITAETKVVVGHSLGSVVAYESLCTGKYPQVQALVTLGSPLGMRKLVFDCLTPKPTQGKGAIPPVKHWTNIADEGDLVALEKKLSPLFGSGNQVEDHLIYNGWQSHSVLRYLTAEATGRGVMHGLS